MAKTSNTTGNNSSGNHQEDKMIVYVDEIDEDYFDVTLNDAEDGEEASGDESSGDEEDEGLDAVDTVFKSRSAYDLTVSVEETAPPVATVSVKSSSTFTASDRGSFLLLYT